jgi:CubicO group peptidase (beta-lactamase class C family)
MQAGFGYGFFAFGAYFPTLVAMAPNNVSLLPVAAAHCGYNQPTGQWTDHFVDCLRNHPLMNQPGAHSIYGYDYDVMGIALGRAYNMTPEALMQTKIFDPLGMTSAFIGALVRESCHPCILLPGLIPHPPLEEPLQVSCSVYSCWPPISAWHSKSSLSPPGVEPDRHPATLEVIV